MIRLLCSKNSIKFFYVTVKDDSHLLELSADSIENRLDWKIELENRLGVVLCE